MGDDTKTNYSVLRHLLAEHPALFISAVYFVASSIGLVYSWAFLNDFGINVFRYAEISDFLLASLKEPFTWAVTLLSVMAVMLDNLASRSVQKRATSRWIKWYGSPRYRQTNYLIMVGAVVFFLLLLASNDSKAVRAGETLPLTVKLADDSAPRSRVLLGTTGRYVFFYDASTSTVDIHPNESIISMTKRLP